MKEDCKAEEEEVGTQKEEEAHEDEEEDEEVEDELNVDDLPQDVRYAALLIIDTSISVLPRLLLQGAAPCPLFVTPCPFEKAEMTPCPFE